MRLMTSIAVFLGMIFFSCKKDEPIEVPAKYDNGMLVLNEGLFQQNNASVSFYDFSEQQSYQQVFKHENNRGLGDTANDFEKYKLGDSTYIIIAVDISSQLEIINAQTMKSVAQIPLFDGSTGREPRHVLVNDDKAYSCNYDGTVSVVNLNTHVITNTIQVGQNPDGMVMVNNKLYVSNSGGLNYPVYDSTISVIDLASETVINTFESSINSTAMMADQSGEIYLISNGNYSDVNPAMLRVDSQTDQLVEVFDVPIGAWAAHEEWIYYYNTDLQAIYRFNTVYETFENSLILDCSGYTTFFDLFIIKGNIVTVDAQDYVNSSTVKVHDLNGNFKYEFTAALNATDVIIN